jgi:hypothetical protein
VVLLISFAYGANRGAHKEREDRTARLLSFAAFAPFAVQSCLDLSPSAYPATSGIGAAGLAAPASCPQAAAIATPRSTRTVQATP